MFRAFADETRLRILHLLAGEEMCVGDLVEVLGLLQPTVSRHLATLRTAGLVEARTEGVWRHYRLTETGTPLHAHLINCLGTCFDDVPELQEDAQRAARTMADGGCCPE